MRCAPATVSSWHLATIRPPPLSPPIKVPRGALWRAMEFQALNNSSAQRSSFLAFSHSPPSSCSPPRSTVTFPLSPFTFFFHFNCIFLIKHFFQHLSTFAPLHYPSHSVSHSKPFITFIGAASKYIEQKVKEAAVCRWSQWQNIYKKSL